MTNEQLDALEYLDGIDPVQVMEIRALVCAYRTALWVRREIDRALPDHDMVGIANAAHQLPTDGRPLWEKD